MPTRVSASAALLAVLLPLLLANAARMLSFPEFFAPPKSPALSPRLSLALPPVLMDVHNTANYELNGSLADAQWAALFPAQGGVICLGPEREPFMLSMFHQLRCLDVIRRDYVAGSMDAGKGTSAATRHCLNYIRQMILCRGDRRLEAVVDPYGAHAVQVRGTQTCRDWSAVYDFVREHE
ncbi:hypothetical protein C8R44DRAFT_774058 [Mycena epipterygia]|nr:hypothetical protein C8R44DRAFT_774058 [Mycena epipterygia]